MKPKKCKVCKNEFIPIYTTAQSTCSLSCAIQHAKQKKNKDWTERKKVLKDELTTVQDYIKIAQMTFNRYIRLRDQGKECISCGKIPKKSNAGHFYSAGGHFNVRFDERNVHLQCEYCNSFLSGNLLPYRENLLAKLGYEEFESLSAAAMETRKFTRDELKNIIENYKEKIKLLKS